MQQVTDETHQFIDDRLKVAEKETVDQMMRCLNGFRAAFNQTALIN